MKRTAFLALFQCVAILLVTALIVPGCENLSTTGATDTSMAQSTTSQPSSTSTPGEASAVETTATTEETVTTTTAGSTTSLSIIAADLMGSNLLPALQTNRYEETDPHLIWTSKWNFSSGVRASVKFAGESVTIKFSGTSISWIGEKQETSGIAQVTLDGGALITLVDLYAPGTDWQPKTVWQSGALTNGSHTLKIECTHTKNDNAIDYWIVVHAFEVTGTIQ